MDTTEAYELLAAGIILLVVVVFAAFHLLRRYRLRRLEALRGGAATPRLAGDRAHNRLALARREADLLEAQGGDVTPARQLIDLAGQSLDARNFDRAYELAQAAHETLVKARREPARHRAAPPPAAAEKGPAAIPGAGGGRPPAGGSPAPAPAPLPKNRAEAQFQLRLFEQDLASASKDPATAAQVAEARDLYVQAHAAFTRADYAEAFRLSLRGRRRVGGHIEALGPAGPTTAAGPGQAATVPTDPALSAEEVASQERCALCGHPVVAGDAFCRGCGAARTPRTCPTCGAPRQPTDTFCGRCGERYGPTGT